MRVNAVRLAVALVEGLTSLYRLIIDTGGLNSVICLCSSVKFLFEHDLIAVPYYIKMIKTVLIIYL